MNCRKNTCKNCPDKKKCGTISKVIVYPDGTINLGWRNPIVEKIMSSIGKDKNLRTTSIKGKSKPEIYCG